MTELVNSAEHGDVLLPEKAIGGTTSHGSDEEIVDLNNLTHFVRCDERSLSSTGIDSNHNTMFELEGKSSGSLVVLGNFRSQILEACLESDLIFTRRKFETEAVSLDFVRVTSGCKSLLLFLLTTGRVDHGITGSIGCDGTKRGSRERFSETEVLSRSEIKVEVHLLFVLYYT